MSNKSRSVVHVRVDVAQLAEEIPTSIPVQFEFPMEPVPVDVLCKTLGITLSGQLSRVPAQILNSKSRGCSQADRVKKILSWRRADREAHNRK